MGSLLPIVGNLEGALQACHCSNEFRETITELNDINDEDKP